MNAVEVKRNNSYKYYKIGKMANAVSSVNVVVQWMLSHCKFKDWCQTYYSNLFALYSLFFKFQVILCIRRVYKADAFSILLKFAASALILWYFLIIKSYIYHESIFTKLMKNVLLICFVIVELVCRWISKAFWTSITSKLQLLMFGRTDRKCESGSKIEILVYIWTIFFILSFKCKVIQIYFITIFYHSRY